MGKAKFIVILSRAEGSRTNAVRLILALILFAVAIYVVLRSAPYHAYYWELLIYLRMISPSAASVPQDHSCLHN